MKRSHALHAVSIVCALSALVFVLFGVGVGGRSLNTVKTSAMSAAVNVSKTPNAACNPAIGAGAAGICAPVQAFAATDAIAKAAGDPETITGHPLGVDVSSNNGCKHFSHADAFVFIKATESTTYTSPCLSVDVSYAKSLGIPYGVYDFLRAGSSTPLQEAEHFVSAVNTAGANTSLPPAADVEVNAGLSPAALHAYVDTWEKYVQAALKRTVVITYTGAWFWAPEVGGSAEGDLWVSGYGSSVTSPASWSVTRSLSPFGTIAWTFWQYSDGTYGPSPHLGADSDVFGGTVAQLNALTQTFVVAPTKPSTGTVTTSTRTVPSGGRTAGPLPKRAVCFGKGRQSTKGCKAVRSRYSYLIARRNFWQHEFNRCIRYADGIRCGHAERWYEKRRGQAARLHKKYSR